MCGDVAEPGRLVAKPAFRSTINTPYDPRQYHGIKHILHNNLLYIGNILALDLWYRVFRAPFILYCPILGGRPVPPPVSRYRRENILFLFYRTFFAPYATHSVNAAGFQHLSRACRTPGVERSPQDKESSRMKKCMSGCLAACAGIFMAAEVLAKDAVAQDAVGQNRPQIEIEVRILEMSAPLAKGLFGKKGPVPGGDVTDDLQERISQTKGVDLLAAPRVVTRAGQSAQIKMVKEMTFVSSFRIAGTNGVWEPVFKTVEPGIVATVVADPYPNDPGRLHGLVEVSFTQVISFTEQTLTPPGNQGSLRLQTSGSNLVCNSLKSQSPVIENRALTMSFDVGNGKRIVLGSIERSEGDGIKSTVVLFRVRVIPRLP